MRSFQDSLKECLDYEINALIRGNPTPKDWKLNFDWCEGRYQRLTYERDLKTYYNLLTRKIRKKNMPDYDEFLRLRTKAHREIAITGVLEEVLKRVPSRINLESVCGRHTTSTIFEIVEKLRRDDYKKWVSKIDRDMLARKDTEAISLLPKPL
tara:strand:+ start:237 stop:695 length:459 start_codon:yes stop_codon:yes gene_type:complete